MAAPQAVVPAAAVPEHWHDPVITAAQAAALLATPHHTLLVSAEPYAAGHVLVQAMPQAPADILTLYVAPQHRRRGLARALMAAALDTARSKGCTGLTLEVEATNTAAIALYTACGLQQIGTRNGYYRHPVSQTQGDALVMAVFLA